MNNRGVYDTPEQQVLASMATSTAVYLLLAVEERFLTVQEFGYQL
jgi:hypothetical protein